MARRVRVPRRAAALALAGRLARDRERPRRCRGRLTHNDLPSDSGREAPVREDHRHGQQIEVHLAHAADVIPAPRIRCHLVVLSPFRGGVALIALLSGANEPSGKGDPDGKGRAVVHLRRGEGRLCFELLAANVTLPAYASHIHHRRAGQAGPVVVALRAPDETGGATGRTNVERRLVAEILRDPAAFYVNVHTSEYFDERNTRPALATLLTLCSRCASTPRLAWRVCASSSSPPPGPRCSSCSCRFANRRAEETLSEPRRPTPSPQTRRRAWRRRPPCAGRARAAIRDLRTRSQPFL